MSADENDPDEGAVQAPEHPFLADERLRKVERLLERAQFRRTQSRGRRQGSPRLVVYAKPNGLAWSRVGITTSRKVGKAVRRNRWRRLVREAFRRNKAALPRGFDLVVIVQRDQIPPSQDEVARELIRLANGAARAKRGKRRS